MKKKFFKLFFLIFSLISIGCSIENNTKPNIIWIVAEDQSQYFFPYYGDNTIELPNINKLLENGTVYEGMSSPYPVCAPARSSIITGMYPNSIGTGHQRAYNYNREVRPESEHLLEFQYYSSKLAEQIKPFTQILRENGYYTTNNSKQDYNFKLTDEAWDESSREASWENRNNNQPFFSVFNFGVTHESQIWIRDKQELKVNPDSIIVPPVFPNDSIVRHSLAVNYSNIIEMDKQMGKIIDKLIEQDLYDDSYIFFYSDHGGPFPRHKRAIYETGLKVPLIIKFPYSKKVKEDRNYDLLSFIDFAPTILSIAGIEIPEIFQGNAFLGSKESKNKRKYSFSASDRFDEITERKRAVKTKKYKYVRNYDTNQPHAIDNYYRTQMNLMRHLTNLNKLNLLSPEQKLWFKSPKSNEEFYDLENDPFELNNLITDKAFSSQIEELRAQLDNWMIQINDNVDLSEKELIEIITK